MALNLLDLISMLKKQNPVQDGSGGVDDNNPSPSSFAGGGGQDPNGSDPDGYTDLQQIRQQGPSPTGLPVQSTAGPVTSGSTNPMIALLGAPGVVPQQTQMPVLSSQAPPSGVPMATVDPNAPAQVVSPTAVLTGATPAPAADASDVGPDIVASTDKVAPPQLHAGLFHHGFFSTGHTGGNILGLLGDGFRANAGLGASYAPRLQQARDAEALQNLRTDPEGALDAYTQTNPNEALKFADKQADNKRLEATANENIAVKKAAQHAKFQSGVESLLYGATAESYPTVRALIMKRAAALGETLDYELPETFNAAVNTSLSHAGVSATDQEKLRVSTNEKEATLGLQTRKADDLDKYRHARLGQISQGLGYTGQRTAHTVDAPVTPTQVLGPIAAKQARGETLTPGEQAVLDKFHPGRAPAKTTLFSGKKAVIGPDGKVKFVPK